MRRAGWGCCAALALAAGGCGGDSSPERPATPQAAVVVWAPAGEFPLASAVAAYTKVSGVPVEVVSDGDSPPARTDLVLTADTGALWQLNEEGGLRPVYSDALEANVPAALRDPDSTWYGLSWRPLVFAYDSREVDGAALSDYAALAAERWRGRLCLSTSELEANRLLLAALIARLGEQTAERTVRGFKANLAAVPFASDIELLAAIADDRCDIGIVDAGVAAGASYDRSGVTVSVPGDLFGVVAAAAVTRHATNADGAVALLEWLSTEAAQRIVAAESAALPVNAHVEAGPEMQELQAMQGAAPFPAAPQHVAPAASRVRAAVLLAERAGYD